MTGESASLQPEFARLFNEAQTGGGIEYTFTIARVTGIIQEPDPMLVLRDHLDPDSGELRGGYQSVLSAVEAAFVVMFNLARCTLGEPFDVFPFRDLVPMALRRREQDRGSEVAAIATETAAKLEAVGFAAIAHRIHVAFDGAALLGEIGADESATADGLDKANISEELLRSFLSTYEQARLAFRNYPRLIRLPQFTVLELVTDDSVGLQGFKIHFSNGSSAHFLRHEAATDAQNFSPDVPLQFNPGLGELREEWRVGEMRLFEVGLPGRYNRAGEWKPLAFPGDPGPLRREAADASDNEDVQGVLFYMLCTGHRVLEFAAKMTAELPAQTMTYAGSIHLHKCNPTLETEPRPTLFLYDGWAELPDPSPDTIEQTLDRIARFFNRMALALDTPVTWRPKYSLRTQGGDRWLSEASGIRLLNEFLGRYPNGTDAEAIDVAIDWYNRGSASGNPFTAFLCFYIAIESVANAVFAGEADLGLRIRPTPLSRSERQRLRNNCIEEKLRALYESDPKEFVERAYFDCIKGTTQRTRQVVAAVFGDPSRELQRLFSSDGGESLADVRSHLAHGARSELSASEAGAIRNRVGEVRQICREFLTRLLLRLSPGDPVPSHLRQLGIVISFQDPRNLEIVSSLDSLPEKDWSIKPEWISWK